MKFAVIGSPIEHSLSPVMHNANFKAVGDQHTYDALRIDPQHFHSIKEIIKEQGLDGLNVTIPHKESILPYLDEIDEQAETVGAVNTVLIQDDKWIGYNTDGIGYVKSLKEVYPDLENAYILILGAGGASKGITNELIKYVNPKITVANRTLSRFDHWNLDVNTASLVDVEPVLSEFDIIINTTPAGMDDNLELPIHLDYLSPQTLVSDIVYVPFKTPILAAAEQKGNPIHNGLDMFVYQGAESYKIWTQQQPNYDVMRSTVLNYL